jgi:nitrate reductase gamma subunit
LTPAAYRLVCMAAGLHCLYVLTFQMTGFLLRSTYTAVARTTPTPADMVNWAILLAAGLYLCWGAPHFVRWHLSR